jgi:hypothetical protein
MPEILLTGDLTTMDLSTRKDKAARSPSLDRITIVLIPVAKAAFVVARHRQVSSFSPALLATS